MSKAYPIMNKDKSEARVAALILTLNYPKGLVFQITFISLLHFLIFLHTFSNSIALILVKPPTIDLSGLWSYTSFLVLATPSPQSRTVEGNNPMARIWEKGQLTISEANKNSLEGNLILGNGSATFSVVGRMMPVTDATPAIVEATARRQINPDEILVYELLGWVLPDPTGKSIRPTIRGSITQSRQSLDWSKAPEPITDQVGAFVLTPINMGLSEVQWISEKGI
jgi:hypothetical protein